MAFIWPTMLFALLAIPALVALYFRLQWRRRRLLARQGSFGVMRAAAGYRPGWRRHLPPFLFLIALAILLFSLARPQTIVNVPHVEGIVILAFDISASMAADDLKPTRMEAAKVAARDFVQRQPTTVQIGVVAFSDGGLSVQAPTDDHDAVLAAINRLAPSHGTSLGNGILASLETIATASGKQQSRYYTNLTPSVAPTPTPVPRGTYVPASIVLLTDGENTGPPDPAAAVKAAMDRGVRIYTVGIGSAAGAVLKIDGFAVQTQLDEAGLKQIAQQTGGAYYNATSEESLRGVYQNLGSQFVIKPEKTEITPILAGAGLFVLMVGGLFSLLWFSRLP